MLRSALHLGIFGAALALTAAGLSGLTLPPGDAIVDGKLAWWRAHAAEYDTLIIGTSRLYHGVIPEILDATAAARGRPIRSFNLAVDGLRPPEDDFVLEKALAAPRLKLRWVIVECNELKLQVTDQEHESARDIYWHDLPRLRILWRRIDRRHPQHGDILLVFLAFLAFRGPDIDPLRRRLRDREYFDNPFPDDFSVRRLHDGNRLFVAHGAGRSTHRSDSGAHLADRFSASFREKIAEPRALVWP